jgi:O-antigen/teichoic acid export membrane protein
MKAEEESLGMASARLLSSLYAGQFVGVIITIVTFITVARLLGPSGYGIYTFAFGFMMLVDFAGNFGIGTYFGRNVSKYLNEKNGQKVLDTLMTGFSIIMPVGAGLTLLGIAISPYVANVLFAKLDISPLTLMLVSCIIFFSTSESTAVHALVGFTKGKLASISNVVVDTVQMIAAIALLLAGYGVNGAIGGMLIGYAVGAVLAFAFLVKLIGKGNKFKARLPDRKRMFEALRYVVPMSLTNIFNITMANFATLYMSLFVLKAVLGNYGASLKGLNFIAVFYSTMSTALLPLFSKAMASKKNEEINATYNRIFFYSLMLTLPFIAFVAVLAKPGVELLLSSGYSQAGEYLTLIALGSMIEAFQYYISNLLISRGVTMPLVKVLLFSNIVQLAVVLLLVPKFGAIGAIIGLFFVGPAVESILFVRMARRIIDFRIDSERIGIVFACNIVLMLPLSGSLLLSSSIESMIAGVVILLVAYPALAVFFGLVQRGDLDMAEGIYKKIPIIKKPAELLSKYMAFLINVREVF